MKPIKTILYACLFLFSFTFTAQSQEKGVSLDFDNYETNMEILANYVAAIKAGDANKLNSYLSDDALVLGLSGTSDTINKKVHLERYTLTFKENDFDIINPVYLSIQTNEKSAVGVGEYSFSWGTVSSTIKGTKKMQPLAITLQLRL